MSGYYGHYSVLTGRDANYNQTSYAPSQAPVSSTFSSKTSLEEDLLLVFALLFGVTILSSLPLWLKCIFCKKDQHPARGNVAAKREQRDAKSILHKELLLIYLPPYLLAAGADWLQGPYKYAVYTSYGYSQQEIAYLFVAGFTSGMILGSFIGGLADYYGRKKLCLCYCLAYTFSVLTKHCRYFYVLMIGRVCGGIATSLLYSCFESWLICAHGERGLIGPKRASDKENTEKVEDAERWLTQSLSISMYGSSLVAIGSGILANFVVESSGNTRPLSGVADDGTSTLYIGGYISAFDLCLVPLVLCATLIACLWEENYGEMNSSHLEEYHDPELFLSQGSDQQKSRFCSFFSKKNQYPTPIDDSDGCQSPEKIDSEFVNTNNYSHGQTIERPNLQQAEEQLESPLLLKVEVKSKIRRFSGLSDGVATVWQSPNILICCIVGSVFEGATYIMIFLWTPVVTSLQAQLDASANVADSKLPLGMIFSSFMVSCMLGTISFSYLSNAGVTAAKCLVGVLAIAATSCLVIACPLSMVGSGATSLARTPQYFGLLLYEFCVGFYYPAMGTIKAAIVPEEQRAAIYNVFRLPMNAIVLVNLLCNLSYNVSFAANAILLVVVSVLQIVSFEEMTIMFETGNAKHCRN